MQNYKAYATKQLTVISSWEIFKNVNFGELKIELKSNIAHKQKVLRISCKNKKQKVTLK